MRKKTPSKPPAQPPAKSPAAAAAKKAAAAKSTAPLDPIVARSVRELASLVGRAHPQIVRWRKRDDWTFGPGPWTASDVVRIQQWAATELVERPSGPAASGSATGAVGTEPESFDRLSIKSKVDVKLKMTREKAIAFALEVQKGKFHDVEECKAKKRRQFLAFKQKLYGLADTISTDGDTKTIIRGRVVEAFRELARGFGLRREDIAVVDDVDPASA